MRLHPVNRFRLMMGKPLLEQPEGWETLEQIGPFERINYDGTHYIDNTREAAGTNPA